MEEYPTLIIKYPHSDHKAISYQERIQYLSCTVITAVINPKKNKNQPHVKLQPIGEWGTVVPFADLKTDLKKTFEKIIEKYWNHLGGAY